MFINRNIAVSTGRCAKMFHKESVDVHPIDNKHA